MVTLIQTKKIVRAIPIQKFASWQIGMVEQGHFKMMKIEYIRGAARIQRSTSFQFGDNDDISLLCGYSERSP
jgi:hypothetical protein